MFKIGDKVKVIEPTNTVKLGEICEIVEVDDKLVRVKRKNEEIRGWFFMGRFVPYEGDDDIEHSPHYSVGNIEVIDFIQDQKLNFALGNAIKYICRCNYKGSKEKDLKKAIQYLKYELEAE